MPPATAAAALVGRRDELALLARLLRQAVRGRGRAVLIEGEPGIGKSALARAVVAAAPGAGCQVVWGTGDELGTGLPLLPFLDALRVREPSANARRNTILGLLRGEAAAGVIDVPSALAEQLLALVTEETAARPVVLVTDDLQWADPASVALWERLALTASHLPFLLIGMMRPVPRRDDLLALQQAVSNDGHLQLTGLTGTAMTEMVTTLAGGRPDDGLLKLARGAAGNPLYLTELIDALVRGHSLTVTGDGAAILRAAGDGPAPEPDAVGPAGGPQPVSLSAAIADRLDFVPYPAKVVLRAAALLGVDFEIPDLAAVLGRAEADLQLPLEEARAAGVLAESGAGLGFRHPLIRAALYDEMPATVRAAWHRDAAQALAAVGAPPDRVARQLLRAGSTDGAGPADEWMLDWLAGTADFLVGQVPGVAAELLTRAVAALPQGAPRNSWLASRLADALYRTGDNTRAEQVSSQALAHVTDPDRLVELHWTLAQCRLRTGQSAEALAQLDKALATPGLTARHRARLLVVAARTHSNIGEVRMADQVAASALAAAEEAGDDWAMGWALHVLSLVTAVQGRLTESLPLSDRALTVTRSDPGLADLRLLLQINKAVTLGNLDRYEEAVTVAGEALHLAGQVGTAIRLGQARCALAEFLFQTGRWDDALAQIERQPVNIQEPGVACSDLGMAALISFHRGEIATARGHLAAAVPYADRLGHRLIPQLALARSLDHEHTGAFPEALTALTGAFDETSEEVELENLLPDVVRLAARTGDLELAQSLAGQAAKLAKGSEIPHRQANALYCEGLLDHDAGRLLTAAERYQDASRPLLAAKAYEAAAAEFLRADDRGRAREAFVLAVEAYTSLGASVDAARLRAAFRPHGIHLGPRARHKPADSGWDSLTEAEAAIAGLVAEGLTNREIAARLMLSRQTVSTHVSHILMKLGVASRTDIARESALRTARPT